MTLAKILLMTTLFMASCSSSASRGTQAQSAPEPARIAQALSFSADSAFSNIAAQVAFGPRVPGSKASKQCADWLCSKLLAYGAQNLRRQETTLDAYNADKLPIINISAQFNPDAKRRVLLLSHWDSRPWADQDPDPAKRQTPIDGANDGASGVGVILELARILAQADTARGLDILFVDAEDYGRRADDPLQDDNEDSWCLGTQYWTKHPTLDTGAIDFAILLDMVGGKDAVFKREYHSQYAAPHINDLVWKAARQAGQASRFHDSMGGGVVDDHVYLLMAGIPAIDIIDAAHPATGSFPPTWHTHADNLGNISPQTLDAVGKTLEKLLTTY